jgi:hypothetical protein
MADTSQFSRVTQEEIDGYAEQLRAAGLDPANISRGKIRDICGIADRRARTVRDWFRGHFVPEDNITPVEEHRLKKKVKDLNRRLEGVLGERARNEDYEDFIARVATSKLAIPSWSLPKLINKHHEVVPQAIFSDWHLDEVVNPEEVGWKNGYNREIAERRLKNYFNNVVKVGFNYIQGFTYPGLCFVMCGDVFAGNIHQELVRSNADMLLSSLLHWVGPVAAGIKLLQEAFGKVWVISVVGNHGRNSIKPIYKARARDNFDWLFSHMVQRELSGNKNIEWTIPEAQKHVYSVGDWRILVSHGDEVKGGSGIAGMMSPLLLNQARMKKSHSFDYWVLGHFHNRSSYQGIRVNGCGVGMSEHSMILNYGWQEPQQDFFLVDPKHGIIGDWPVFFMDEDEEWMKKSPILKRRSATDTSIPIAA